MSKKNFRIHDWEKWQTYRKDRGTPPWIKVHRCLFSDQKWAILSDAEKGQLVSMWVLAADKEGLIPADPVIIKKLCMLDEQPNLNKFISLGLLDGDLTTTRQPSDKPETETETETEKECAEKSVSQPRIPFKKIVSYLNKKAGSEFSHTTSATKRFIKARWNEGHKEKDFFIVIENKCSEWRTNPDMIQYLRPQTLFGTKFESYLQQKNSKTQQNRCEQCEYNQRDLCKNLSEKSFDPIKCTAFSQFEK